MYVEKSLREALEGFLKGRKVIAITDLGDGSLYAERIEKMLPKESRYMVDVPVVEDPEFEKALANMVKAKADKKQETDPEEMESEEDSEVEEVPVGSRKIRWKKKR